MTSSFLGTEPLNAAFQTPNTIPVKIADNQGLLTSSNAVFASWKQMLWTDSMVIFSPFNVSVYGMAVEIQKPGKPQWKH